ncbi:hypothetical protein [Asaia spathodeae]|uniref:Uncharacterized protein n=1 Tax=Asaia spathodeae TaxID=657016 RepID=A0ABX2P690_9PROT|nr:hypothetical protein [Asaia spathodeae]GBR19888.1 hypothetical protein AA105894_2425 [Asaia spathodeae NBRC 105894]
MSALTQRENPRITGAVMSEGQMLCFDATDYMLEPGAQAVVIGALGRIHVATIGKDHPDEMRRKGMNRGAIIPYVSGCYPHGTRENLCVKVLGRFIPLATKQAERSVRQDKRPAVA